MENWGKPRLTTINQSKLRFFKKPKLVAFEVEIMKFLDIEFFLEKKVFSQNL